MKLKIYMKSGNVITLRGITYWKATATGNLVTFFEIKCRKVGQEALIVNTIDLSQIEAITESPWL